MSDYTKVNLKDLDNVAQVEGNESRFARKSLDSDELGISFMHYKPNYKSTFAHSHKVQEEVYVVVKGSGRIILNDKVEDLALWDTIRVTPATIRAFEPGADGLDILAIGGKKPEEGDGEKHEITWPS